MTISEQIEKLEEKYKAYLAAKVNWYDLSYKADKGELSTEELKDYFVKVWPPHQAAELALWKSAPEMMQIIRALTAPPTETELAEVIIAIEALGVSFDDAVDFAEAAISAFLKGRGV